MFSDFKISMMKNKSLKFEKIKKKLLKCNQHAKTHPASTVSMVVISVKLGPCIVAIWTLKDNFKWVPKAAARLIWEVLLLQSGVVIQVCSHIFTVPFVWRAAYCHCHWRLFTDKQPRPLSPLSAYSAWSVTRLRRFWVMSEHAYQGTNRIERDCFSAFLVGELDTKFPCVSPRVRRFSSV